MSPLADFSPIATLRQLAKVDTDRVATSNEYGRGTHTTRTRSMDFEWIELMTVPPPDKPGPPALDQPVVEPT